VRKKGEIVVGLAVLASLLLQVLTLGLSTSVALAQAGVVQDNLYIFTTVEDFQEGETEGTEITDSGNGAIVLKEGASSGSYTSSVVETVPFEYMVLSWNADTPRSSYIEIQGRVRVLGEWTDWLSWGRWSTSSFLVNNRTMLPGSGKDDETDDPSAKISIDELIVKGQSGETADAFQYRFIFHSADNPREGEGTSPKVRMVSCTLKNTLPGQEICKVYPDDAPDLSNFEKDLDVPCYSQMVRDYKIANRICSPTSVAMVLSYYGFDVSPEEIAWDVCDHEADIFGNWSFNVAAAASYGLSAYVDYIVPEEGGDPWYEVKQQIAQDRPVVVSVKYKDPSVAGDIPPVEGVPISSTDGHLVLVRGFTWKDGVEYVIVNDPAAPDDDTVRREYRADQFFDAWAKRAAYIIYRDVEELDGIYPPLPIVGELVPEGQTEDGYRAFRLVVDGETVNVNSANFVSVVVSRNGGMPEPFVLKSSSEAPDLLLLTEEMCQTEDDQPITYTFTFIGKNKDKYKAETTVTAAVDSKTSYWPIITIIGLGIVLVILGIYGRKTGTSHAS